MKRCFWILMIVLFVISFGFSESNLFSLAGLDCFINIEELVSMDDSWYFSNFERESKHNLCKVNTNIQRRDKKETHTIYYNSKGLPIREESKVYEFFDYKYNYDEKDRLISYGDFTYEYIDDFQRKRYCRGKLQVRESLSFQKDKIYITVVSYAKRDSDDAMVESSKRIYEYVFTDDHLTDIYCTSFNMKGIEKKNKNHLMLSYENEKIVSAKEFYGDKLRVEQAFIYQDDKLVERFVSYPADSTANYSSKYSDFDEYGNFQKYTEMSENGTVVSLSRMIDYR